MLSMARLGRNWRCWSGLVGICFVLCFSPGCSHSRPPQGGGPATSTNEQRAPFDSETDQESPGNGSPGSVDAPSTSANALPFRDARSRTLPPGTLLTVRLENSLSSTKVHAGDPFTASVAAPLTVNGDTLIQRGAPVTGRIESARLRSEHFGRAASAGYIRLSLSSVSLGDRQVPLQTSSLFARGVLQPSGEVSILKGRDLTFRLTSPITLEGPNALAKGPLPNPDHE